MWHAQGAEEALDGQRTYSKHTKDVKPEVTRGQIKIDQNYFKTKLLSLF